MSFIPKLIALMLEHPSWIAVLVVGFLLGGVTVLALVKWGGANGKALDFIVGTLEVADTSGTKATPKSLKESIKSAAPKILAASAMRALEQKVAGHDRKKMPQPAVKAIGSLITSAVLGGLFKRLR